MRVEIYLPKEADNYCEASEHIKKALGGKFGGWTELSGSGGWVNDSGEVIEEPVSVFVSFGEDMYKTGGVVNLLREVQYITEESAVMGTIDGEKKVV